MCFVVSTSIRNVRKRTRPCWLHTPGNPSRRYPGCGRNRSKSWRDQRCSRTSRSHVSRKVVRVLQLYCSTSCGSALQFRKVTVYVEGGTTDLLRPSLRAFSLSSRSSTGDSSTVLSDCTLSSISLIWSALSAVCWKKLLAFNRTRRLRKHHIVVLDENRKGAHDCLQGQKHIGGCVGNIDGDLRCFICRPPARLFR